MKRRQALSAVGALAAGSVVGCGGGGEGDAWGDQASEIAAYNIPRDLVPENNQYQVELSFRTNKAVKVYLVHPVEGPKLIDSRPATQYGSHKLGFAMFRCTNTVGYTAADFSLRVEETTVSGDVTTVQYYYAGTSDTTPDDYRRYQHHTDCVNEYEWSFFSRFGSGRLVSVRFFPIAAPEHITFDPGEYVRPIANTARHISIHGHEQWAPRPFPTSLTATNNHSLVISEGPTKRDTICINHYRGYQERELIPSYLAASEAEKPLLKRCMLRHIDRYTKRVRSTYPMDTADDEEVHHLLGNEIFRLLGGKSLVDHITHVRTNLTAAIQNGVDQLDSAFHEFCRNELAVLSSGDMIEGTRNLLDSVEYTGPGSRVAGGGGVSTQLQASISITAANYPWPGVDLGGGIRISWGLSRSSLKCAAGTVERDSYTVSDITAKGTKLGFTFILKGFNGSNLIINGVSMDIEVTVNFTVLGGAWRVDSIQLDPVIDLDTRTWLGKKLNAGLTRLLSPVVGGSQSIAALPEAFSYSTPTWLTGLAPQMGQLATKFVNSGAQLVNSGIKDYMNPALQAFSDLLGSNAGTRTWGTGELSPLRFVVPNSDVNDPTIPFRGGFRPGGIGWQPGVKYIAGFGVAANYNVPYVPPGEPKPPGTVTYSGFLRVAAVADFYSLYGNPTFIRATTFPWEF